MTIGISIGRAATRAPNQNSYPTAFTNRWNPDFNVTGNAAEGYGSDYNPKLDKPTGTTLWVDNNNGDNTTGDGSQSLPYKTIAKAVDEGADIVNIKAGRYWRLDSWEDQFSPAKSMAFVAVDGPGTVIIGRGAEDLSWESEGSGTYSTTRSSVRSVLDFTETGHATKTLKDRATPVPLPMEKVANLAAVQAHAGHAWAQDGSTLYVKTHDSRAPDEDVVPLMIERNTRLVDADITLYFEGLEIFGDRPIYFYFNNVDNTAKFIGVDCGFRYSGDSDNAAFDTVSDIRLINCTASHNVNSEDGFDYKRSNPNFSPSVKFLEVNCESFENGDSDNDNGSTTHHSEVYGIRIGGEYSNNPGPGLADTQGAWVLNYGVIANNNYIGFQSGTFDDVNPSVVFVKDCSASGNSQYDRDRSSGGQLISLGGNSFSTSNGTIVDGTDDFWLTLATIAPDAIVGLFSVDELQYWDNVSDNINELIDASPRKYNLTTPAGDIGYLASLPAANSNPVIDFGTAKHSRYFAGASAMDLKEVIIVGLYNDGSDTGFEDYEAVLCGSSAGGQPRIIGSIGTANLHAGDFTNTVSKNGAAASSSILPAPMGVYRFTPSSVKNSTWDLFGTDAYTNRGWIGYVAMAILTNRDLTTDEFSAIKAACDTKYDL